MTFHQTSKRYTDVDISAKVRAVAAEYRESQTDMGAALKLSRVGVSRRMNGGVAWSAHDLAILADHFNIPIGRFYGDNA